jgi:hypothetical protein
VKTRATSSVLVVALALVAPSASVRAQTLSSCDYETCALSIAPRLTGLDVVRGKAETRVASLAFLWPRDPSNAFGPDSLAGRLATRALRQRRIAAAMTNIGFAVALLGSVQRSAGHQHSTSVRAMSIGVALLAGSVPIHFSADANLARAVWYHNRRFAQQHAGDRAGVMR